MDWVDYWNGKPTIYVSARHQDAHDFDIAFTVIRFIRHAGSRVLDFGCGDATRARLVANRCAELLLWDAAPSVRKRLAERYGEREKITVLTPEALAALEPNSIDLITVISVVQYLEHDALTKVLDHCRRLLSQDGVLIIADIIPPKVGMIQDAWQFLRFAYQEGFALSATMGLIRTALSDYYAVRSRLSLRTYSEAQFIALLAATGFAARRLKRNLGHNQLRMAFESRPSSDGDGVRAATAGTATGPRA